MTLTLPGSLPKFEQKLAFTVWIFHSLAAFCLAFQMSNGPIQKWLKHWMKDSDYLDGWKHDASDAEWTFYRTAFPHILMNYAASSLGIFLVRAIFMPRTARIVTIGIGFVAQVSMSSFQCIMVLYTFTAIVVVLSKYSKLAIIPWILCIAFIVKATKFVPFSVDQSYFYCEFNVYLYGAIKTLNYSLYTCNTDRLDLEKALLYFAYLPYSITLIVLFEDFSIQIDRCDIQPRLTMDRAKLVFTKFLRLVFWFSFIETFLHLIHVNSIFNSPFTIVEELPFYQICATAYLAGQFFHVKYIIIFGVPAFFAFVDGMTPPPPPICISRVSLYSRMWRYFDNGLYQFLKHQVYIKIMSPKLPRCLSVLRAIGALIAVFSVVLAWHGTRTHYVYWVSLSAFELIIEKIGWAIWQTENCQKLRAYLGENVTRRILATLMLLNVTPGIFGVFFFLGQDGVGEAVFRKVVVKGFSDIFTFNISIFKFTAGLGLLHILILGYFYNNVCLDIEAFYRRKKLE